MIVLLPLAAIAAWSVLATVAAIATDGRSRVPDRMHTSTLRA